MGQSKTQLALLQRLTPVVLFGAAVLAWVLIQHAMATRLEQSTEIPDLDPAESDFTQQLDGWAIQRIAEARQDGYTVFVTMRPSGATVWLWHPMTQQWDVVYWPRSTVAP